MMNLLKQIEYFRKVLADEGLRMQIIKDELLEIKEKYGDEPRTTIEYTAEDFRMEDMIPDEEVVITISHLGYIKRTPLVEYRRQNRGGRGARGSDLRGEDFLEHSLLPVPIIICSSLPKKASVSGSGLMKSLKEQRTSKGRAIQNLINIEPDDKVRAFIKINDLTDEEYLNNNFIILCTRNRALLKRQRWKHSQGPGRPVSLPSISMKMTSCLMPNLPTGPMKSCWPCSRDVPSGSMKAKSGRWEGMPPASKALPWLMAMMK